MNHRAVCGAALAVLLAGPAFSFTGGSGTVSEDSLGYGTGLQLNGGYFFKDTMFYSRGRGGPHVDLGKAFPVAGRFGVWLGAGALRASGTMRSTGQAGARYDTHFDSEVIHADLGVLTPFTPFPLGIMVYRHRTSIGDHALDGPFAGADFTGKGDGIGWGFTVHLLFEWFPWDTGRPRKRGPGFVFGYMGLVDMKKTGITVKDALGRELVHQGWKPAAGESLRAGIEWEF